MFMYEILRQSEKNPNPTSLLSPSCPLLDRAPLPHPSQSQPASPARPGVATSPVLLDVVHCGLGSNKEGWDSGLATFGKAQGG